MATETGRTDPGLRVVERKPRDDELDVFGLTDRGKVRRENQDHFLFCSLHKTLRVRVTSLATPELLEIPSERLASLFMVADGVGSGAGGEAASRVTVETMADYVTRTMQCYYRADSGDDENFLVALREAATSCHETVLARARESAAAARMATTLTMGLAIWPRLFLLHLGDSRAYQYRDGRLKQLTRDQTMAQELVDRGAIRQEDLARSPFRNVLASAIGGTAAPDVSRHHLRHGDVMLLCTDGLTKHVTDARIGEVLGGLTSSEQACRALVDEALAGGGTDNVTVMIARTVIQGA